MTVFVLPSVSPIKYRGKALCTVLGILDEQAGNAGEDARYLADIREALA